MKRTGIALIGLLLFTPLAAQTPPGPVVQKPRGPAPAPALVEGQSIETWSPELPDNKPLFPEQTRAPYRASVRFTVTTLNNQLRVPWGMDFLPDGKVLVTERLPGTLRILDANTGAMSAPLSGLAAVSRTAQFGMLDVVLDPDFRRNRRIFFTFFEAGPNASGGLTNSNTYVARATLDQAANAVRDVQVIFRTIPAWPSQRLGAKTGGRIVFDPAGNLIIVIGDRDDNPQQTTPPWLSPQMLDNDLGKTIRITPDGLPAPGNPYLRTPGARGEIWTIGHRSPQGLAYEPGTGKLWQSDLGPRGGDELNILSTGKNYGWPVVTHGIDYPGTRISDSLNKPGMEPPVYYWDPSRNPSGIAFYRGNLFPQWRGSLFVAMLEGRFLDRLTIRNGKVVAEEPLLLELKSRIRDVAVGPDGAVYVLTDGGTPSMTVANAASSSLLKLTPK
jgi:glucose/arabinose dehydrogenase